MPRTCPQCSHSNPDSIVFCTRCGHRFQEDEQAVMANIPSDADPSATLTPGSQQMQALAMAAQMPATPAYAPSAGVPDPNQAQGGYQAPPQQPSNYQMSPQQSSNYQMQQQQQQPNNYQMPPNYGQQPYNASAMAMPNAGSTLQRAFASKGTPVRHQSWLIDGKQTQPATLRNALIENIQKQGVMGVGAIPERLREHGMVMEERDYVRVQYGTSSIFVYMAPMGQNLYISRTSTVQQPYSRVRIGVVIGLFVLMLISFIAYALINPSNAIGLPDYFSISGWKTFFSYPAFGLLFVFIFLLVRSLVSAITEMDFLAFLRPHTLNDFTLDALSAVEQITDKGIRETVTQAGLNSAEITQAQSFALRQPLYRL
ncbi:MAG: zinc ribbon domain-containing protein [Ktedonobacteraceae bacterium]